MMNPARPPSAFSTISDVSEKCEKNSRGSRACMSRPPDHAERVARTGSWSDSTRGRHVSSPVIATPLWLGPRRARPPSDAMVARPRAAAPPG